MRALKYDTATGEVTGDRKAPEGATEMPPLPAGVAYFPIPDDWAGEARDQYVSGGKLVARKTVAMQPVTMLAGETMTVPVPAGANWTLDGVFAIGPKAVSFAQAGSHLVQLHGAHRGAMRITVTTLGEVKAGLLAQIDEEAERRKMLVLTPGGAKKMEYDAKRAEVEAYYSLGGSVTAIAAALLNLSTETRARRFRYANAEVALTGDPIATVMARFRDGCDVYQAENARLSAIAQRAKRAVRAATTQAAAMAATKVTWTA